MRNDRRDFLRMAAAMGLAGAWSSVARASAVAWRHREDLFPEGVASGDPDPSRGDGLLWAYSGNTPPVSVFRARVGYGREALESRQIRARCATYTAFDE